MKALIMCIFLLVAISPTPWLTDFDFARKEATEKQKYILLNFSGSDWCGPCIQLTKNVFEKQPFLEYAAENLVLVRADFPRHKKNQLEPKQRLHNEKLADRYNANGKFPLTLLLDADGKVVYEWDGFSGSSSEEFVKQLDSKINGK